MDENSVLSIFNGENRLLLLVVFCVFCFCFFVVVVVVFFLKTLNCCFCSWGGGRDGGDFSSCLVLFVLSMSLLLRKYFCFSRREGNKIHCAKRGIFRPKNEIALIGG